jgi:low molecular weight phosphotyrosine protein phosphatase
MAEAVLNHQISQRPSIQEKFQITVDSAGTGAYHEGDAADER